MKKRKWLVVLISWSQLHIGFKQSWKFCLNVWSGKWIKLSLILVSSFEPSKFWVQEILFGSGLINVSIRFLSIWHEDELRILISRLFHSVITAAGKKQFFWKNSFYNEERNLIVKSTLWSIWVVVFWYWFKKVTRYDLF